MQEQLFGGFEFITFGVGVFLGATSINKIGEVRLFSEIGGGGGSRLSKIPNFSLLDYIVLPTQRGLQTALRKQIHDIGAT